MGSQQFCLRWNNHQTNLLSVFDKLLTKEAFVDVTIACEGANIKAHKVILSACSPFFEDIFAENPCKHPIVIMKDMKFCDLKAIVEFMYKGEVNVSQDKLAALLRTAEALKIKGLTEMLGDQSFDASELEIPKNFPFTSRTTYSSNPTSVNRQSAKKRRRKQSGGEIKNPIPNKSPSPNINEENSKSPSVPSNKDGGVSHSETVQSDQGLHLKKDDALNDSNSSNINNSDANQEMLDPSSFMQQSLTENQVFENDKKVFNDKQDRSNLKEELGKIGSSSPFASATDKLLNIKVVKQEKLDQDSYYVEDITHILPQSKQDLMVRGLTMIPVSGQTNSIPVTIDDLEFSSGSPSRSSDSMVPVGIDNYSNLSGTSQSADILPQAASGAIIIGENYEGVAGPSAEQASPGRSSGTGPRFHASVIANVLIRVSGTVCPFCSKNFSSKMSLVRHMRCIHTDPDSIQKHECHLCSKSYIRKDKLHDHMASVHQLPRPDKQQAQQLPEQQQPEQQQSEQLQPEQQPLEHQS